MPEQSLGIEKRANYALSYSPLITSNQNSEFALNPNTILPKLQ
jgi:hypothetical protein